MAEAILGRTGTAGPYQFQVMLPLLREGAEDMQDIARILRQMSKTIGHEANNISFITPAMFQVKRKLKDAKNELYHLSNIVGRMSSALSDITAKYEKRERNIIEAWH